MGLDSYLKRCKMCGNTFRSFGSSYCNKCIYKRDDAYLAVRDYIYDNPGADLMTIEKETAVNSKLVLEFLREGRIILEKDSPLTGLKCIGCGQIIEDGRYCLQCKKKLEKQAELLKRSFESMDSGSADETDKKTTDNRGNRVGMHIKY